MNIERNISDEVSSIAALIQTAESEYTSGQVVKRSIPADYRVLFVLFRSVTVSGVTYTVDAGSTKEKIFYEAVDNFKHSVENFANGNVHIIPTIKEVTQNVVSTITTYLQHSDIASILLDLAPAGMYDAVITASGPNWGWGGGTLARMLQNSSNNNYSFYGYSGCAINMVDDPNAVGHGYDVNYPYLVTTNTFIHEWMHQLENFRNLLKSNGQYIVYPFTHAYYQDYQTNPTAAWMYKDNYKWNKTYFDNVTKYPHVVERTLTSFYRAVLACEVEFIPDSNHKVGMYPAFWWLTPNKIVIGKYIIQDSSSQYLYSSASSSTTYTSTALSNSTAYFWDVFYNIGATSNVLKRLSCIRRSYYTNCSLSNTTYTRVGTYDEGEYLIVNKTQTKVLAFSVSGTNLSPKLETYRTTDLEKYTLSYYNDCFYKVSPVHNLVRYLDLYNNWDLEDNTVSFYIWTGYYGAQTWQFRYLNNGYDIMPLTSPTRSLSYHDNALHIVSASNIQKWRLEKVDNGKFVFEGKFKIKDVSTGKFLLGTGNTLKLDSTGTEWEVREVDNNYYTISATIGGTVKYIDVLNAYDGQGQTVQVQYATGYPQAQNWKFMLKTDGSVILVPKLSLERGLKSTTSSSTLTTGFGTFTLIRTGDLP